MKIWRMSMRVGNRGYEMWPLCRKLGVASITYWPFEDTDFSIYTMDEAKDLLRYLSSSQKFSLLSVAYVMKKGDIIYVKQGTQIVGRGVVKGPYKFDHKSRLRCPIHEGQTIPWNHQVPVDWDSNFEPINIKLGAEPSTVLELSKDTPSSKDRLRRLEEALIAQKPIDDKDIVLPEEVCDISTLKEGARQQITVNRYERSPEARRKCIIRYGTNCFVCGFKFADVYGEAGKDFIHVHHLTPLFQMGEGMFQDYGSQCSGMGIEVIQ